MENRAFKGLIDEVRVWDDALTDNVLTAKKYEVLEGSEDGLIAYWNFDLPDVAIAYDATNNKKNGVIIGGKYVESFSRENLEIELSIENTEVKRSVSNQVVEYFVTLPIGTTSMTIIATPFDNSVTVTGAGTVNTTDNYGTYVVTATSANGEESIDYTVFYVVETPLTLKHSYTFADGTAKDIIGGANGEILGGSITDGIFTSSAANDYIVLPSQDIALNNFPSITMEAYVSLGANEGYSMLSYFGGMSGANSYWMQLSRGGTDEFSAYSRVEIKTNGDAVNVHGSEPFEGETHHYVSIITNDSLYWYIDGTLSGSAATLGNGIIAKIDTANGWLCHGGWNDPTWFGSIYEFNIYSGVMDEQTIGLHFIDFPNDKETTNATLSDLTVDGTTITDFSPFNLSYYIVMPNGNTTIPTITATTKNADATAVVTNATTIPATTTILVTAADGETTNTYTVNFSSDTGTSTNSANLIKVFPNISGSNFTVHTAGGKCTISMFDITGKMVNKITSNLAETIVSAPRLGMYILVVENQNSFVKFKVIKTE